ncbi:histidine kinase [Paenibacillus sp. FSL R7-0210]|uniref:sensor histidine kinase n=1 Tax=Paenibacillus sp. FSL R7-0210 TaxID=2921676 RepID=UPI0030FC0179
MFKQYRTFYTILSLILLSTVIVMVMYTVTINTSLTTVKEDIKTNNLNRMRFLIQNLDHNVGQLSMVATALETDSMVGLLPSIDLMDKYDQIKLIQDLTDKMKLQSFSEGWNNQISIYSSLLHQWIGSPSSDSSPPQATPDNQWTLETQSGQFVAYRIHPSYSIRVTFPQDNLRAMLSRSDSSSNNSFFYRKGDSVILSGYSGDDQVNELLPQLLPLLNNRMEGSEIITVGGIGYMVNFLQSDKLGWYLVDYLPLDEALRPIERTRNYFYAACAMLFMGGVVTALFLYRKVQIPILELLKGVRLLKHGDFSHRIVRRSHNEFDYLYINFNEMAAQIEDLIEKVYKEKIMSREALVKQLQAQINPHFLYNCLFFIDNMTRLGNDEAVTAMTQNLAQYFRYTTRLDKPTTTLEKELGVVGNYLNILCLRMERLNYEIRVPDSMKLLSVPKLLVQPLVENSVIHGIEKKQGEGLIRITGIEDTGHYQLIVEDDGIGMSGESIQQLMTRIKQPPGEEMGCALWNIGQRMQIYFDAPSRMEIEPSTLGGLCVILHWPKRKD